MVIDGETVFLDEYNDDPWGLMDMESEQDRLEQEEFDKFLSDEEDDFQTTGGFCSRIRELVEEARKEGYRMRMDDVRLTPDV